MIKQILRRRGKIALGFLNTHVRRIGSNYNPDEWWDASFYTSGVSDQNTIAPQKDLFATKYHYASVEMPILRHLRSRMFPVGQSRVLDIGSGSGHWIDFYSSLGAREIVGMDVSATSCNHLKEKYGAHSRVAVRHGKAADVIPGIDGEFDIVNAIGVMFHIVDDREWERTIHAAGAALRKGGIFIVGGHFGYLDGLNVQIDREGAINKRLRGRWHWKRQLGKAGFREFRLYANRAYLWIQDSLPENNILVATK